MPENQYCTQMDRNITPMEYYRCTQGTCSIKNLDCSLIITPAQSQPKYKVSDFQKAIGEMQMAEETRKHLESKSLIGHFL